jgi:hypothetical protein
MKQMTLHDFLTEAEITKAAKLGDRKAVRDQLITPNMERINAALGQENDPDYLSFCVEYVMRAAGVWA